MLEREGMDLTAVMRARTYKTVQKPFSTSPQTGVGPCEEIHRWSEDL